MILGVSGKLITPSTRYAPALNGAGIVGGFPPCWLGGHAYVESIVLEIAGVIPSAASCHSLNGDGGYGGLQITAEPEGYVGDWPFRNWDEMQSNALFAIDYFLKPAMTWWNTTYGYTGDVLIKCTAAEYNVGRTAAVRGHDNGNVDAETENGNYAARVLEATNALLSTGAYPQ